MRQVVVQYVVWRQKVIKQAQSLQALHHCYQALCNLLSNILQQIVLVAWWFKWYLNRYSKDRLWQYLVDIGKDMTVYCIVLSIVT